jgi:hypothetical protein
MSRDEREAFLAGVHIGVVSIEDPGRGPLTAPVWYAYEPGGDLVFVTGRKSRKGQLLASSPRISLCAQTESPPYQYVTVEGPVRLERPDYERDVKAIAYRYLGPEFGERYLAGNSEGRNLDNEVLVRLKPERWLTVDYGKM